MTMEKSQRKGSKQKRKSLQTVNDDSIRSDSSLTGGSVISVKEASNIDKTDTTTVTQNGNENPNKDPVQGQISRPSSGRVPSPRAGPSGNQVSPLSTSHQRIPSISGSVTSMQSKEAWAGTNNMMRPSTTQSNRSANVKTDVMTVAEMNEAEAYVPYSYAKDRITAMINDMKKLKASHVAIVHGIEDNYRKIEDETQLQFNMFVMSLRQQYGEKVKGLRQVMLLHGQEQERKQDYWDAALLSLSQRNRQLLADKKTLLTQNKTEFEKLEAEREEHDRKINKYVEQKNKEDNEKNKHLEQKLKEGEEKCHKLNDENKNEKQEKEKLLLLIANLRDRKGSSLSKKDEELVQRASIPVTSSLLIPAPGISDEERRLIEDERRRMEEARERMASERKDAEREREELERDRNKLQDESIVLHGRINDSNQEKEIWKAKYEAVHPELCELATLRAQHDALGAQYAALVMVASVDTPEDKQKTERLLEKADNDRTEMEEEKKRLQDEIREWEAKFEEKNGRPPVHDDRDASAEELYVSAGEADTMITSLDQQITTLERLQQGQVPPAPLIAPVTVREHEIKIVEVMVPDPEVLAQLEMTRAELEAMRRQLVVVKDTKSQLSDEHDKLVSELSRAGGEIARMQTEYLQLEAMMNSRDQAQEVIRLKEKIDAQNKTRVEMDKDMKKLMKEAKKRDDKHSREKQQLEDLLAMVVAQVKSVHEEETGAAQKIEDRLNDAEQTHDAETLVAALNMIHTGSIPQQMQKDTSVVIADQSAELDRLEERISELEAELSEIKTQKDALDGENQDLEERMSILNRQLAHRPSISAPIVMPIASAADNVDVEDLLQQIDSLQVQVDNLEGAVAEERANHEMTRDELDTIRIALNSTRLKLDNYTNESALTLESTTARLNTELQQAKKKLSEREKRVTELESERLKNIPVDTAQELAGLNDKLAKRDGELSSLEVDKVDLTAKLKEMKAKLNSAEKMTNVQLRSSTDAESAVKAIKVEKALELKLIKEHGEKKERQRAEQERKKIETLEKKILHLQMIGGRPKTGKGDKGADSKAIQTAVEKSHELKKENADLNARLRQMEAELKKGGGQSSADVDKVTKRHEKILKELEKRLDSEKKKNEKNDENLKKQEEQLKILNKDGSDKDKEIFRMRADLVTLGLAAKEGVEAAKKVQTLTSEVRKLTDENKHLAENVNSERILRKKYYNMVQDMKGKIRVYCRVRPLSDMEKERKNVSVVKSPDEYSVVVSTTRGVKEFQYDNIFMPESTQEQVFEDTNNLVQSAVDGYNVCIFAYGQTGSGKTFTIVGDPSQEYPGIAPRTFNRLFELLDENKHTFKSVVTCYMLELYNEKLLDLFMKPGAEPKEMEIKKDKKGMVMIQGAEVKLAKNAKQLNALFEQGSKARHTATTMMNADSSRSHLIIALILEMTNISTGQVLKGKLSLVDLAGSERVGKTGASAQQLKEAMSINKSLSALGDVISALSSEQDFVPYRNNKLTMLMQDSLGGNAKTLMFVNVSPADYNMDETVVSLTYASRVKLITNDAQKNADSKEVAKLRAVIAKMRHGDLSTSAEYE